jgi:hypothetical protein
VTGTRRPTLTYVYGLLHAEARPSALRAPRGLAGLGHPRLLGAGDGLWLVVADAPTARYGAAAIDRGLRDLDWVSDRALAHHAVLAHFGRAGDVLPMRLFTLFDGDDRALAEVAARRPRLRRALRRVANRREWGLRARLAAGADRPERADGTRRAPGTRFLLRKRDERTLAQRRAAAARREVERAVRDLGRLADGARRQAATEEAPGSDVLLDAAFLVPMTGSAAFQAAVRRWRTRLRQHGCELTVTGPWPPYNFVEAPRAGVPP